MDRVDGLHDRPLLNVAPDGLGVAGCGRVRPSPAEKSAPDERAEKRADALRGASGADGAGRGPAKPADKDADGKPGYGPPAHARSVHNRSDHPGRSGRGGALVGPSHGEAMRAWAKCVSGQAGKDAEGFDPEAACGVKPTPPGHLKQKATTKKP